MRHHSKVYAWEPVFMPLAPEHLWSYSFNIFTRPLVEIQSTKQRTISDTKLVWLGRRVFTMEFRSAKINRFNGCYKTLILIFFGLKTKHYIPVSFHCSLLLRAYLTVPPVSGSRWRWSRTFWMIRCVTSARAHAVEASSPHSSVPTSRACSTTVSTAGPASTHAPAASSTNRWWRREETDHATSPSAGADGGVICPPASLLHSHHLLQTTNHHHHHHHNYNRR